MLLNGKKKLTDKEIIEKGSRALIKELGYSEFIRYIRHSKEINKEDYLKLESTTYILGVRDDVTEKELVEIAIKISTEGGDLVMTAAERLRQEGMEKGIEKGKKEGERIATIDNTLTLLTLKFGTIPEKIRDEISQLDVFTLKIIISEIFSYESINEINK